MIATQYVFLDIPTLQQLIAGQEKSDKYRVDELFVAIALCRFGEKSWGKECVAGFPLKGREAQSIPTVGSSDIAGIKHILNVQQEEAHDVDVVVVEHTPENSQRTGQSFQIKYFNKYQADLTTEGLVQYIQSLTYAKTETALVILLATGEPTTFTQMHESIDFEKFPFSALYFVGLYGDTMRLIQVWPNLGKNELEWSAV